MSKEQTVSTPTYKSVPFTAFLKDAESSEVVRSVLASYGWSDGMVHYGDVRQATIYLKEQDVLPEMLLVEVPSAAEAPELLDRLADVCTPTMQVIVAGKIDEFSFFSWLQSIGIDHYLLEPFNASALNRIVHKLNGKDEVEQPAEHKIIAVTGARGGVGTTTIASNLAYLLAEHYGQKTAFLDLDPYFGTASLMFETVPNHGLREALDKPERIDDRFLEQVMTRYGNQLSVLGAEEAFKDPCSNRGNAATALLASLKQKFTYTLIDVPRQINPLTYAVLEQADHIITVGELSLLSLRDMLRMRDYLTETLQKPEPIVVMNREGLASKHELSKGDFEKNYGRKIDIHIPCMMEAFSASSSGEILIETTKNSMALDAIHALAGHFVEAELQESEAEKIGVWWKIMGRIKHVR